MNEKTRRTIRIAFIALCLIGGLILNQLNIGINNNLGFESIGNWMIFVAFIAIIMDIFRSFKPQRKADERDELIGYKASRITFTALILFAAVIMVIDATKPITMPTYMLMNYIICGMIITQLIAQKYLATKY